MSKKSWFLVAVIIFLSSILRLWYLDHPDTIADENGYIDDAYRLLNRDPYISIRYHPFRHPECCQGHPFLAQILTVAIYKVGGVSNFTSRLPYAIAGILTIIVFLTLAKGLETKTVILASLLLAISPFAVRFSRLVHLDAISVLWYTLVAIAIWDFYFSKNKLYLILAGISAALAISTKLNGIIALFFALILLFLQSKQLSPTALISYLKRNSSNFLFLIIPTFFVAVLLNDPSTYLDGIIHPASVYKMTSLYFWIGALQSLPFWSKAMFNLLSPIVLITWAVSVYFLIKEKGYFKRFLLTWQAVTLAFFVFHRPGLSGEHGLVPSIPPIVIGVAYLINKFKPPKLLVFLFVISILPFTFFYGIFLKPLPYRPESYYANRTISDTFYLDVIEKVNSIAKPKSNVFLLPQTEYPIFSLRKDLHWNYYEPEKSDLFVVSDPSLLPRNVRFSHIEVLSGFEDGETISRFLVVKAD